MDGKQDLSKEQKNNSAREENQAISQPDQANNEEQNAKMEFREALLSLTLEIYDQLGSADDFDDVARKVPLGEGEFVLKLPTTVEENCEPTADHLRVVKLCGQIVASRVPLLGLGCLFGVCTIFGSYIRSQTVR